MPNVGLVTTAFLKKQNLLTLDDVEFSCHLSGNHVCEIVLI